MLWKLIASAFRAKRRVNVGLNDVHGDSESIRRAATEAMRNNGLAQPSAVKEARQLARDGQLEAALELCRDWVKEHPKDIAAHVEIGNILLDLWSVEDAVEAYRHALELAPTSSTIFSGLLFHAHYLNRTDADRLFALHRKFGDMMCAKIAARPEKTGSAWDPERRLRIGYVSPNFSRHSVGYFAEPVIRHHDRSHFQVYCYYTHPESDSTTKRFRQLADHWHHVADASNDALEQLIREDHIDILVDLAGHSAMNRLEVFARKPAPIQITWLGYPDTTGLDTIDFRVTDVVADPLGSADERHTERLLRIDDSFICYQPPDDSPPVRARAENNIVFASCNNLPKLNEPMIKVWGEILNGVPGSRLILKSKLLECPDTANRVTDVFVRNGIDLTRVEFKGWIAGRRHHLDYYGEVDIALDTFPYNGTTTTCEALWMGVPVVTLAGLVHMSRVGASIVRCVGLNDLVATSAEEYATIAIALARDEDRRRVLRANLRDQFMASHLFDQEGFTKKLEFQFRHCWIDECERHASS